MSLRYPGGLIRKNPLTLDPALGNAANGIFKLSEAAVAIKNGTWPAYDPYFDQTTLLLHGDGTNGAQNNTFLDSSTNNFTITRNGNTTQGTFSPFSLTEGQWSVYFDGSGDYLTFPTNSSNLGSSDFSMEAWVYPTVAVSGNDAILCGQSDLSTASGSSWVMYVSSTSGKSDVYSGSTAYGVASSNPTVGAWSHIAFVRTGGTLSYYLNGVRTATRSDLGTASVNNGSTSYAPAVGAFANGGSAFNGYISNARVIIGSGGYNATSSTLTVPTTPLTSTANTKYLTCQSNRFKDNSANAFAITVNGNTSIQPFSPFAPSAAYSAATNGGSGYFDGSGDYLTCNQVISTADFSIEAWVYPTSFVDSRTIFAQGTAATAGRTAFYITTGGLLALQITTTYVYGSTSLKLNSWNHVAVTRSSGAVTVYLNGVSDGTGTISTTVQSTSSTIGEVWGTGDPFIGYMSSLRVSDTARAISLPSAPYTSDGNTELLLNFTNAGILDNTGRNVLETVGNAQISTSVKKFGTGSLAFDGDDYLLVPPTQNLEFGSADFTIEFWWYPTSTGRQALYHGSFGADWSIGIDYSSVSTNQKIGIWASSNGSTWNLINADLGGNGIGTTTVTQNAWNHIAYVRSGTTWMLFVNGNRDLNLTGISGSIVNRSTYQKGIGVWWNTSAMGEVSGYIDDLRITKGVARYTSNFTPQTSQWQDQ